MKTGQQKQRLNERLTSEIEERVANHLASMDGQVKSLSSDIERIVTNARTIIENDTAQAVNEITSSMNRQSKQVQRAEMRLPAMIYSAFGLSIVLVIATALGVTEMAKTSRSISLGITTIHEAEATYLIFDQSRSRTTNCTVGDQVLPCIRIGRE